MRIAEPRKEGMAPAGTVRQRLPSKCVGPVGDDVSHMNLLRPETSPWMAVSRVALAAAVGTAGRVPLGKPLCGASMRWVSRTTTAASMAAPVSS